MKRRTLLSWVVAATGVALRTDGAQATPEAAAKDLLGGMRKFRADLSAANQPMVTVSSGRGVAEFDFDIASETISWTISFEKPTSPVTAITLHGPAQPGTNAAAFMTLGRGPRGSSVTGRSAIGAGEVQYMLLGWTYVLISTQRYPDGEMRGKVDIVPRPPQE